ncbi:MAG: hypothetical protein ACFBSC_14440 [Microcoleaceae cyanobacterium]
MDVYINLQVPELWIEQSGQSDQYQSVTNSPTFTGLAVVDWVQEVLQQSAEIGGSPALRAFRKKTRNFELSCS